MILGVGYYVWFVSLIVIFGLDVTSWRFVIAYRRVSFVANLVVCFGCWVLIGSLVVFGGLGFRGVWRVLVVFGVWMLAEFLGLIGLVFSGAVPASSLFAGCYDIILLGLGVYYLRCGCLGFVVCVAFGFLARRICCRLVGLPWWWVGWWVWVFGFLWLAAGFLVLVGHDG